MTSVPRSRRWRVAVLLTAGGVAVGSVVGFALKQHGDTRRCASGWINLGPRCCFEGQTLVGGSCVGRARTCPVGFHAVSIGCAIDPKRVAVAASRLSIGPNDWQSEQVAPVAASVPEFWVDRAEVTLEQWQHCVSDGGCPTPSHGELGQPVTKVTPEQAATYCERNGGRLPLLNERMALTAGAQARRYPWGQTGLVCRRAMFGVVEGPCGEHGSQPDAAGSRPDGQSPDGVLDLSGSVAELVRDTNGRTWVCGGSFRSRTALDLKSWGCVLWSAPADDIGFRCVYDRSTGDAG